MGLPVLLRSCLPPDAALFLLSRSDMSSCGAVALPTESHRAEAGPHEGTQARVAAGFGARGPHPLVSGPAGLFALPEGWYLKG